MANILDTIVRDHANMRQVLDVLDGELDAFDARAPVDYALVGDIAGYLLDYPDRFHHPLEDLIVSAMVRRDALASRGAVYLRAEHEDLHRRAAAFANAIRDVAADTPMRRAEFSCLARDFSATLRRHIEREDRVFLPLARNYLSDADLAEIAAELPALDDPLFGGATRARYETLRRTIVGAPA